MSLLLLLFSGHDSVRENVGVNVRVEKMRFIMLATGTATVHKRKEKKLPMLLAANPITSSSWPRLLFKSQPSD